ncbi:DUF4012 domain-containing protein [Microbacterium telephonicum]|uniref:Uncharacterized protein DUF4012 n=1 Tax=Microbacterium telephonicum TaxID=1714841 RepID=A0A498C4P7_9MICO|nr:DUF4012 domain-containing protein [Microbacterium telephonicum]RLK48010.1 uncharacterized protein DUF4012 [Microbacterium telephonicum]
MSSPHPLPASARTAGRVFAWVLAAALVALLAASVWIGVRAVAAYGHLMDVQSAAATATDALRDPATAPALVDAIAADTSAARELTSDPVWRAAEQLPWIGPQLSAVSTVAAAADDVATNALTPLSQVASSFSVDQLRPVDGRIDLAPFTTIADAARTSASGLSAARSSVDGLEQQALVGPVRSAVTEVSTLLGTTSEATDALARAMQLLPAMLGQDGARDYLIVFQNNAEWRSLGGIVGAMALVHTDGGSLSMTTQGSSSDFARYDDPVMDLGPEVTAVFGTHPARWIQNVTQVPDFTVAAPLAREMWSREFGVSPDGVIALDPVALSYLLAATGPVALPTGDTLTADNAVSLLLNEVYLRYERPADQDAFFAAAAAAVFDKLAGGAANPTALVEALARAGDERRLLLWSAIPEDQAVLADTTLAGPLPPTDATQLGFGVYLNDGTGSKMDYYVTPETTVAWGECTVDDAGRASGTVTLTLTLTNNAPADAATSLPEYITGGGSFGTPAGTAKTVSYLYLPAGAELVESTRSDGGGFGGAFHDGRQVMSFGASLTPGQSASATVTVRTTVPGAAEAVAWVTPTADAALAPRVGDSCRGS